MAEAAADAEEKPVVRSGGIPLKLIILIAGGTLLLGLVGTVAFVKLTGHSKEEPHAEAGPSSASSASGKDDGDGKAKASHANAPGAIYDVDPFIVNLADVPEARYLKLTVKLELDRPDISSELGV